MDPLRDVTHPFDLSGMRVGDWFIGCIPCAWRLGPGQVAAPYCPECGKFASIFDVTETDRRADPANVGVRLSSTQPQLQSNQT